MNLEQQASIGPTQSFTQLTNLKELYINSFRYPLPLPQLTDFLKHVPHLEKLDMSGVSIVEYSDSDDLPSSGLKSLSISKYTSIMKDLQVVNTVLEKVLPLCLKLAKMSSDCKLRKQFKPENNTPSTTVLDLRAQEKLTVVYCDKRRYCVEAPSSSQCHRKRDGQPAETGPFAPEKYYVTLLSSNPISLFDIREDI